MRWQRVALVPLIAVLSGCVGAAISGGTFAAKAAQRDDLRPLALAGDAEAQYRLGNSWCCMGPGFDTQTATEWFCSAALQGHDKALFELGRIYDGVVSRTPAPGQKLVRLATVKRSNSHALAFYRLAASRGHGDAATRLLALERRIDAADQTQAAAIADDLAASCTYEEVFSNPPAKEQR